MYSRKLHNHSLVKNNLGIEIFNKEVLSEGIIRDGGISFMDGKFHLFSRGAKGNVEFHTSEIYSNLYLSQMQEPFFFCEIMKK